MLPNALLFSAFGNKPKHASGYAPIHLTSSCSPLAYQQETIRYRRAEHRQHPASKELHERIDNDRRSTKRLVQGWLVWNRIKQAIQAESNPPGSILTRFDCPTLPIALPGKEKGRG
jgi:hypothetical protein